jgi:hypothetical protein
MNKKYFSERAGRAPGEMHLDLDKLKEILEILLRSFINEGYLQESLGYECTDTGFNAGTCSIDLQGEILLTLNKPHLLPFPGSINNWSEDDLFDVIEFIYQNISKPTEKYFHDWNNCGIHATKFNQEQGRNEYRDKINRILNKYDQGFSLSPHGEVISIPDAHIAPLLDASIPSTDKPNVVNLVEFAIHKFYHRRASLDDQRVAVRSLVDVLEYLRPQAKAVLIMKKDEADLFEIANRFGIRHHKEDQQKEYDYAIWYPWMFQYYLAAIHAILRLIEKAK